MIARSLILSLACCAYVTWLVERDDGVIELHPLVAVPADQAWFWCERWQRMEREAEADVTSGRVAVTDGPDEFLDELDATA